MHTTHTFSFYKIISFAKALFFGCTNMKIFTFLLLVTVCQADRYARDEEAFTFLSNMDMNKIVQTFEKEVNQLIQKKLSPKEIQWVRNLGHNFAECLRQELEKSVFMVTQSGDLNRQFTTRMFENLRRAADSIANGLDLTQDMLDKFVDDLMNDIGHLEDTGLLDIEMDPIFQGITDRALVMFEEKTRKKRDIGIVIDNANDTLPHITWTMTGRYQDLQDFFKSHMNISMDKIKPHVDNMKILARNFINNIKSAQTSVLQHAIEFFTPFAHRMGYTYMMLMSKAQSRLKKITETPIPAIYK